MLGISTSRAISVLFLAICMLTGVLVCIASATANTKVLTVGRAIATWPAGIPAGEKRPVVVFLPGWGGVGNVDASVTAQNTNLVNQGYVTLAIGFDDVGGWTSNIDLKTKEGLDKLCADATIPANCSAIVLEGQSYGGIQNYWNIEYLRSNGYNGLAGSTGKALGFVSEDAGYSAPGNWGSGVFVRTGLADTASYSVAMIQNLGDMVFPVDLCTDGNCGARTLSLAHLARNDNNVFSFCPPGGSHGDHSGFVNWNAWCVTAIKRIIHTISGIPTFTGYTSPTLFIGNGCVNDVTGPVLAQVTPVPTPAANQNPAYTFSSTEAGAITYGGSCASASTVAATGNNTITLTAVGGGLLPEGIYNNCTIAVTDAAANTSASLAITQFTVTLANPQPNSKVLTVGRAIATWPAGVPTGEKRPVVVFLPGWGGAGNVDAVVSTQNTNLVNEGYVTLAIGFDDTGGWTSNIDLKTKEGLDKLCADAAIPANCSAIVLDGQSYGGIQNYWIIEYLRSNGYNGGTGNTGKALGFVSEDAGYSAPGNLTDPVTGAFTRTGLADTASYSVAMIENLGDTTFPVDECTWGNCGARTMGNAHLARGDSNIFSICPSGGEHGTRGFADWNAWVISAIKKIIHTTNGIPAFTGYISPLLPISNACVNANVLPGLSVSGAEIMANGLPVRLHGVNMVDPFIARNPDWYPQYTIADYATLAQDWHAKVIRISIYPTQWKNMNSATLLAGLATQINAALGNGMYVIISYHVIGWPNGYFATPWNPCLGPTKPDCNPDDFYDSNMLVANSFWTQMAQTYGADRRVIFDLWNEPVHDAADWAAADPNPYWPELKLAYTSLIQTVRNNGAQNIVLATGNRWASWLVGIKDNPLADPNVVYAYHKYSDPDPAQNNAIIWNKDTGGLLGVKPVIVSEWGYEDSDIAGPIWPGTQASYGIPFTQWMDSNHLGNLAWSYHYDNPPALLKSNGSLTMYGAFVKNYVITSDLSAPLLAQVTPVPTPTKNQNPSYTFSSTEAGVITYSGNCSSASLNAVVGNNTIILTAVGGGLLAEGIYIDCAITVTNASNKLSVPLVVNQFVIERYRWAKIERTGTEYSSLQVAYDATLDADVLRVGAAIFPEYLSFAGNRKILMKGGYDPAFVTNAGSFTTIRSLTIGGLGGGVGRITIQNVKIK